MFALLRRAFGSTTTTSRKHLAERRPQRSSLRVEALEERALMSVGPEFHINTKTFLDQSAPAVASQPVANGRSVVVWADQYNQSGADIDIRAQIYDGFGNKVGGEIVVANSIWKEYEPSVAMDAQGNFVVVWTEEVNGPGDTNIRAQRFFANGAKNGSAMWLTTDTRREFDPDVAMDQWGNFVVSYTLQFSPSDMDVYARRYTSNGTFLGSHVVAGSAQNEYSSSIARSPDGRFSIGYQVNLSTSSGINSDIRLNRYTAAGSLLGTYNIATSTKLDMDPDVAMDRNGNTIVVYEHAYTSLDHDIKARKVFNNGVMGSTMNVDISGDYEFNPTVAMDLSDGDFVVAYQRLRNTGSTLAGPNNLIIREMSSTGSIKNTFNLGDVGYAPALSINDSDIYFLAYTGYNKSGDPGQGIFGRRGLLV